MLKHILFLRPIDQKDLEKIILYGPHGFKAELIDGKIYFGRLEISFIIENELVTGLECDVYRKIDTETFYSIAEFIGTVQMSMNRLWKV
jgi:hypothetical protein